MKQHGSNDETTKPTKRKGKKLIILIAAAIAVCICAVYGAFSFSRVHTLPKCGTIVKCDGVSLYYEKEELSPVKSFMLRFRKGEKVAEFSGEDIEWYKLKGSDDIKTLIRKKDNEYEKCDFTNYYIEDNGSIDMKWLLKNVFSISSGKDILGVTVDGSSVKTDEAMKDKLYSDLLSLHFPHTDEEKTVMERMYPSSDIRKISIRVKNKTLNFVLYPYDRYLKLDEGGVYSLFTVLSDDYSFN